jgi:GTP-binding protein
MSELIETTERLPTVAIIGRPNVGKSTLFNRIVGARRAIVGNLPGITRDRIYGQAEWQERGFQIVDTGGLVPDDDAVIPANIFKQARAAIDEASLLLFVVDVRAGISPLDEEIAQQLRTLNKPVFIIANKAETARTANEAGEFHRFGYEQVFPVSAEHGLGMADLLDAMMDVLPEVAPPPKVQTEINVAIIGRPNVGKSSLVNKLLGEERVIVTPIAGTTRDAVDSVVSAPQEGLLPLRVIDTAGIRRKGKTELMEEKMSVVMARKHIERADVALLLIDAVEGATHLDASIAGYAHDAGTSVIIVVNKWDVIEKDTYTAKVFEEKLRDQMRFLDYAPVIFLSAKSGQRVHKLYEMIAKANDARNLRVSTGQLNQFYNEHLEKPKATSGKSRLKVFYLTQASVAPPTFVLFTNARNGQKLHFSYDRYLINRLRETFDFYATPIRIQQRGRR